MIRGVASGGLRRASFLSRFEAARKGRNGCRGMGRCSSRDWSLADCFEFLGTGFLTSIAVLCIKVPCKLESEFARDGATRKNMEIHKDLVAASSTPLVLAILADGDSYGYRILQRVRELCGGRLQWTDGMLYPVLHRLERLGHVRPRWETAESGRRRKYYRITSQGRAQLAEERRQCPAVRATSHGLWQVLSLFVLVALPASPASLPHKS